MVVSDHRSRELMHFGQIEAVVIQERIIIEHPKLVEAT